MYVENPSQWGTKRICQDCAAKYYDLKRSPAVCPKCQAAYVEPSKPKRATPVATGAVGRGRGRAIPFGHEATPGVRRSGAHSPFAEARPAADDAGKVTGDAGGDADADADVESDVETDKDRDDTAEAETVEDRADGK